MGRGRRAEESSDKTRQQDQLTRTHPTTTPQTRSPTHTDSHHPTTTRPHKTTPVTTTPPHPTPGHTTQPKPQQAAPILYPHSSPAHIPRPPPHRCLPCSRIRRTAGRRGRGPRTAPRVGPGEQLHVQRRAEEVAGLERSLHLVLALPRQRRVRAPRGCARRPFLVEDFYNNNGYFLRC